ncbi:MAG TPA: DNA-directed RNA polymerase subunit alpha, partial [Thermoleophilia bacterium]|nr:DNA-directed RNA polymerase subunit alpha [Thermoleophilia bacterium]
DRGFGHTFGNALRRVLLSSIEGAAVSSVKFEGVAHEFTTIKGVKEDATDVILNLKGLVCRLHGEIDEVQVRLYKDKPGRVVAADIDIPAELEVFNSDHHIATLADGGTIEMMLSIRRGTGYVSAEGNKTPETIIGVIPIDSIFSPVRRVSYHVESARVGQRTDYDKLILDITTNGAVTPEEALRQAAEILMDRMSIFTDPDRARSGDDPGADALSEGPVGGGMGDVLIEELELGVRSYNCLKREGIQTIGDLLAKTEAELLNVPNLGQKSIDEVQEKLSDRGLSLRSED